MSALSKNTESTMETSTKRSDLLCQFRAHKRVKSIVCDICNKNFHALCNLKVHLRSHTGERPFACNHCNKRFTQRGNLNYHLKTHADITDIPVPEKTVACEVCHRTFAEEKHLNIHMATHREVESFACNYCNKQFDTRWSWKYHTGLHVKGEETPAAETRSRDKSFGCDVCQKTFVKRSLLNIHKRRHTGEKPFACEYCGKRFSQKGNLKSHLHRHGVEEDRNPPVKSISCDICQITFSRLRYLKVHLRMHTGEKPYSCSYCDKQYSGHGNFKQHLRRVHPNEETGENGTHVLDESSKVFGRKRPQYRRREMEYVCHICSKHFRLRREFNQHLCIVVRNVKEVENAATGGV